MLLLFYQIYQWNIYLPFGNCVSVKFRLKYHDFVLIHDGARPFVDNDTINRVIKTAVDKSAIPAVAVVDTLKKSNENRQIVNTVDRNGLWRVQTPQGFPFQTILKAHEQLAGQSLTDDAAVAEFVGLPVVLVDGNENNFKITTFDDLKRAEKLIMNHKTDIRTGIGFDVHAFENGNGLWLCGLFIPYTKKLAGHSDADVALHALTDALLGACGAGDIGLRFPPSDMQWKGKESSFFVKDAVRIIGEKGGTILNVDITIIGEEPKIGPHRTEMVTKLSEMLNISTDRINVKGTTTEHLGFTGRKEGLASQAVASVLF